MGATAVYTDIVCMPKKLALIAAMLTGVFLFSGCSAIEQAGSNTGKQIGKSITGPQNLASDTALNNDVHSAASQATLFLTSQPFTQDFAGISFVSSDPDNVIVIIGKYDSYVITGTNSRTKSTYSFDSTTGVYR